MEGYVGVLRSHADEETQHITQTQESEPVLVRDVTSTGHLYQPIRVENTYPQKTVAPRRDKSRGRVADKFGLRT